MDGPAGSVGPRESVEMITPRVSETGAGDAGSASAQFRCTRKPQIKTFCNGVSVPVFEASDTDDSHHESRPNFNSSRSNSNVEFPFMSCKEITEFMNLFRCPICQDVMVEATAASCGHTFCSECLETWTRMKPICPICSKQVQCRIRLYNEDILIEKMINRCAEFPAEIARRLYDACKTRMERDQQQKLNQTIFGKVRESLDETMLTLRCKGVCSVIKDWRISKAIKRRCSTLGQRQDEASQDTDVNLETVGDLFKISSTISTSSTTSTSNARQRFAWSSLFFALGALSMWSYLHLQTMCGVEVNFFYYIYLCITRYDGSLPEFLKTPQKEAIEDEQWNVEDIQVPVVQSWWERIIP